MPIFVCDICHAMDNSARDGNYWDRLLTDNRSKPFVIKCSECNTGKWHDKFPKRIYQPGDEKREGGIHYIPKSLLTS